MIDDITDTAKEYDKEENEEIILKTLIIRGTVYVPLLPLTCHLSKIHLSLPISLIFDSCNMAFLLAKKKLWFFSMLMVTSNFMENFNEIDKNWHFH